MSLSLGLLVISIPTDEFRRRKHQSKCIRIECCLPFGITRNGLRKQLCSNAAKLQLHQVWWAGNRGCQDVEKVADDAEVVAIEVELLKVPAVACLKGVSELNEEVVGEFVVAQV